MEDCISCTIFIPMLLAGCTTCVATSRARYPFLYQHSNTPPSSPFTYLFLLTLVTVPQSCPCSMYHPHVILQYYMDVISIYLIVGTVTCLSIHLASVTSVHGGDQQTSHIASTYRMYNPRFLIFSTLRNWTLSKNFVINFIQIRISPWQI